MNKKNAVVLVLGLTLVGSGVLAYGRYTGLQERMRELREERDVADEEAAASARDLEEIREQHQQQVESWGEELKSARETISSLQEDVLASRGRERLLEGQARALRGELEETQSLVLASTDEELVVSIPEKAQEAYGRTVELGRIEGADSRFWTGRPGLEVWGLSLEETLSLRDQVDLERGISTERGDQIQFLVAQVGTHEEIALVWEQRVQSTERVLSATELAMSDVEDQLEVADRQIGALEEMVYFRWWPDFGVGVTCGVTMRRGDPDCVAGASLNWRLTFR